MTDKTKAAAEPPDCRVMPPQAPPPSRIYKEYFGVMVLVNEKEIEAYRKQNKPPNV